MSKIEKQVPPDSESFYFDEVPKGPSPDAIRRFLEKHFPGIVNRILIRTTGKDGHYVTEEMEFAEEKDQKKKKRKYFKVKGGENESLKRTFGSRNRYRNS